MNDLRFQGSSKCAQCPFGYTGDGRICIQISDTANPSNAPFRPSQCSTPNICHPQATCIRNGFAITCICPPHFTGSGIGPFGCVRSNSTFDGCSLNPCHNGGTCFPVSAFGFRCECPPNTAPPRCIRLTSSCSPNPCTNGGTCVPGGRGIYRCVCLPGRIGRNCQTEARSCGGVLNGINGTLRFPLTGSYQHNSRCAWLIKTDEDKVLNVTFTKFNLEVSRECRYDWLQVSRVIYNAFRVIMKTFSYDLHRSMTVDLRQAI